jgi:hypothetical protein
MIRRSIIAALVICLIAGCSGIGLDRKVENNTFTSLADPEVQIQVSPSFTYLGKVSTSRQHQIINGAKGLLVSYSSYLFLDIGKDNVIRKGVLIRVDKINRGSWGPGLFDDVKNKLTSDELEMNGQRYEHFTAIRSDIFTDDEMKYVSSRGASEAKPVMMGGRMTYSGYIMPKCFMMEAFGLRAGSGSDVRLCVYYFEDLAEIDDGPTCKEWVKGDMLPEDQERIRTMFMNSRESALTFIGKPR